MSKTILKRIPIAIYPLASGISIKQISFHCGVNGKNKNDDTYKSPLKPRI
jgi:hypothetical protein